MLNELCLDANIFIKMITPETDSFNSRQLFYSIEEKETMLFEPALAIFEVASALRKKMIFHSMSNKEVNIAFDFFCQLPIVLQWQSKIMQKALKLSQTLNFKNAYDCSYLAVAQTRLIPFITLDEELYKKAKSVYKKTYTVGEFLNLKSE